MANKTKQKKSAGKPKVQKAKRELKLTDLKIDAEGNYIIKSREDAIRAVELAGTKMRKINQIKTDELSQLEADYEHLRKALKTYQDANEIAEIKTPDFRSDLVERTGSAWVWSEDDIPKIADKITKGTVVVPLYTILKKKIKKPSRRLEIINMITSRTLDPGKLDDAIGQGLLKSDDVQDAFVHFVATTYVQIKENCG